jgi:nicotinate-nucleotide adenylyltransferase
MDAFRDIHLWRKPVELLSLCDFIVVSRPGHSLDDVKKTWSEAVRARGNFWRELVLRHKNRIPRAAEIHLLDEVHEDVSSTEIRAAARQSIAQLSRLVPRAVAEYIRKQHLYTESSVRTKTSKAR